MTNYAELEIALKRSDIDTYEVDFRFTPSKSDAEVRLSRGSRPIVHFDLERLRARALDPKQYGQELKSILFAHREIENAYVQALRNAEDNEVPLRFRLCIGPDVPELQSLKWESLCDPVDNAPLSTSERVLFSRYLNSDDWRRVPLGSKTEFKALIAIANPSDLGSFQLPAVDVANELAIAKAGLDNMPVEVLASSGQATINNIKDHLRQGIDIFYLVCHGTIKDRVPHVWLEKDTGESHPLAGNELVRRLKNLEKRPRLVILSSCQSAGSDNQASTSAASTRTAIGPKLAEIGVPGVVAMQGNITMQTANKFFPIFFRELQVDGQIDRALAVARSAIRDRPDWWVPVLFMRLKSGRMWYAADFAGNQHGRMKWPGLITNVRNKECTPILGPGLTESLMGSHREIARSWAKTYNFPMAPYHREDLPQVAQYVATDQQAKQPRNDLLKYVWHQLMERYSEELGVHPSNKKTPDEGTSELGRAVSDLVSAVGKIQRQKNPEEPHQILAQLPLPIYITTNPGRLLSDALEEAGYKPQVEFCRWKKELEVIPTIYDKEPDYQPTVENPLVFHLYGCLHEPRSLVLTEDNYFDYLIGITKAKQEDKHAKRLGLLGPVKKALVDSSLMFLGFRLEEWSFRILLRSILNQHGVGSLDDYTHLAVQLDPEEGHIHEPERARQYLESYFHKQKPADISIFWGSSEDFLKEFWRRWQRSQNGN